MRRLNVRLLVILMVSGFVFLLGAYVVHAFQVSRTADALLVQAEKRIEEGQPLEAEKLFRRYLRQRPEDMEVQKRRALAYTDYAESEKSSGRDRGVAIQILEQVLRDQPDDMELRKRTADFTMKMGRFSDAIVHYERIIEDDPDDAEARVKLAQSLALDNQLKESRSTLEACIEKHPEHIPAYTMLSQVLRRSEINEPDAAVEVIESAVSKNADDPQAYLARASFQMGVGSEKNEAETLAAVEGDIARALELDPQNEETLIYAGRFEARRSKLARDAGNADEADAHQNRAKEYAESAAKFHPDSTEAKGFLASVLNFGGERDAAREEIAGALKESPLDPSLLLQQADIYLADNDVEKLRKTIADLRRAGIRQDQIDLYEARALMLDKDWRKASELLERIRPRLVATQSNPEQIDLLLGTCYAQLGRSDAALTAFRSARSQVNSDDAARSTAADQMLASALVQSGKIDEGVEIYRRLARVSKSAREPLVSALIQQMAAKPKSRRNWSEVERMLDALEKEGGDSVQIQLSRVEVLSQQGKDDEALRVLEAARQANPDSARVWMALALFQTRSNGAEAGVQVLNEARQQLPPEYQPALLNAEVRIVLAMPKDEALQRLPALEEKARALDESRQGEVLDMLGQAYGHHNDFAGMERMFRREAELQPTNTEVRRRLLSVARSNLDKELAKQVTDELKQILPSDSPLIRQIEAEDIVIAVDSEELPKEELDRARRLVDAIEAQQADSVVVPRLRGEIERLDGNIEAAISNYQRAIDLGENNPTVGRRLLTLLTQQKRLDEVGKVIDWLKERGADQGTEKIGAIAALREDPGNVDEALPLFEAAAANSNDYRDFVALGQLRQKAGKPAEAEAAFRQALALNDQTPETWVGLVRFLATTGRTREAEEVIDQAAGKLPAEMKSPTLAACYELIGKSDAAEASYLQGIEDASDKTVAREELAKYYERSNQMDKLADAVEVIITRRSTKTTSGRWRVGAGPG
ncbi:MAG: tetratricopeptide repeat protein [Pirellulales bacterium]